MLLEITCKQLQLFKVKQSMLYILKVIRSTESLLGNMKQKTACMEISSQVSRDKIVDSYKQLGVMETCLKSETNTKEGKLPEVRS